MYRRTAFSRARKRQIRMKKIGKCLGSVMMTIGIGGIFLILVVKGMGTPESKEAEHETTEASVVQTEEVIIATSKTTLEAAEKKPGTPVIMIDPGHGGTDEGSFSDEVLEKDINLGIALQLEGKLRDMGYQVIMTRQEDTFITKELRAELANQHQADLYISIHQNTFEQPEVNGMEIWYDGEDTKKDSKRLAKLIDRQTIKMTGANQREIRQDAEFFVTSQTSMPSCLIETGFLSNPKERDLLVTPEYQDQIAIGIAGGIDLYFHPKTMYLTFDDGPSKENTSAILDILKARDIKATFFVVGENVRKNPEVAQRIVDEGHTIGIHCNRHKYEDLYESVDTYIQDFEKAYDAVLEVTGVEAKLFRFPGGSVNAYNKEVSSEIIKEMTARGFIYFDWNASLEDSVKKSSPEQLILNARQTSLERKTVILLAHDLVYNTVLSLENLLDEFPEYEMKALTPDVPPMHFK